MWSDLQLAVKTVLGILYDSLNTRAILPLRNRHMLGLDVIAICMIPYIALAFRMGYLELGSEASRALALFAIVALVTKLPIFYRFGLYNRYWRYAGVNELAQVGFATGLSTCCLLAVFFATASLLVPYRDTIQLSIILIDGLLTLVVIGGFRFCVRALDTGHRQLLRTSVVGQRVLVIGAGEAGSIIVRDIRRSPPEHDSGGADRR